MKNLKVIFNNKELDSIVYIDNKEEDKIGLIFAARDGKNNKEYNKALEIILYRLQKAKINTIKIVLVTRTLKNNFPEVKDRTIFINGSSNIYLLNENIKDLRKYIGKKQSAIKVDSKSKGGNYTKRIKIFSDCLIDKDWEELIKGDIKEKNCNQENDINNFDKEVYNLIANEDLITPQGNTTPIRKEINTFYFERDKNVAAWVLKKSNWKCENCGNHAPFIRQNGKYYLEVHHIKPLSEGGPDTIDNTIAVCPNCHKEFHYGIEKEKLKKNIFETVERLIKYE